jgi:hypothetical protein
MLVLAGWSFAAVVTQCRHWVGVLAIGIGFARCPPRQARSRAMGPAGSTTVHRRRPTCHVPTRATPPTLSQLASSVDHDAGRQLIFVAELEAEARQPLSRHDPHCAAEAVQDDTTGLFHTCFVWCGCRGWSTLRDNQRPRCQSLRPIRIPPKLHREGGRSEARGARSGRVDIARTEPARRTRRTGRRCSRTGPGSHLTVPVAARPEVEQDGRVRVSPSGLSR